MTGQRGRPSSLLLRGCPDVLGSQDHPFGPHSGEIPPRPEPPQPEPALLSDINMLVLSGGRERTNSGYRELLQAAGLRPDARVEIRLLLRPRSLR